MSITFPDPDSSVVMVHDAGGQRGPYTRRELLELLMSGDVDWGGHFGFQGLANWLSIGDHAGLVAGLGPKPTTADHWENTVVEGDGPVVTSATQHSANPATVTSSDP